jgi:hypothetical protein
MALNNPPDQPSVEQITTKNTFSDASHDYHPLTGTPFPENNPALPTTPTTLATLTTPASDPSANLASSPPLPTTPATLTTLTTPATTNHLDSNHALTPHTPATRTTLATTNHPTANFTNLPAIPTTPATPTTLTTLATTDHPDSNFPLPLTTLVHTTLPSIVTLSAHCFQFTKNPIWLILLCRNHLMLLSAEEKNDCKRGASCMNLNRKKLLKLNVRSRILIPQRRAAGP